MYGKFFYVERGETFMALWGLTGHLFWQMPHPTQSLGSTYGLNPSVNWPLGEFFLRIKGSVNLIALSETGQCSSHTRHSLLWAQTRHIERSTSATPNRVFFFPSNESLGIAPVGHTLPQRVHWYSQYPISGTRRGVHIPSRPHSKIDGWSPLVMQTFMQLPQRIQRSKNSCSFNTPGGRITLLTAAFFPKPRPNDKKEASIRNINSRRVVPPRRWSGWLALLHLRGCPGNDHANLVLCVGQS